MKRPSLQAGVVVLAVALLGTWLIHHHARRIDEYPIKTLSTEPPRLGQQHVGELVSGRAIHQLLDWSILRDESIRLHGDEPFCLSIFFANYYDRSNYGVMAIDLQRRDDAGAWETLAEARIDQQQVRNYRYHPVCFDKVTLSAASAGPAQLRLSVLEGPPDASVTAYLGQYNGALPPAVVDGEPVAMSLIHRLQVRTDHSREQMAARVLLGAVGAVLIAVLYGLLPPGSANTPLHRLRWRLARMVCRLRPPPPRLTLADFTQWRNIQALPDGRWQAVNADPLMRCPRRLAAGWYRLNARLRVDHRHEDPRHANLQVFLDHGAGEQADNAMGLPLRCGIDAERWLWLSEPAWLRVDPIEYAGAFVIDALCLARFASSDSVPAEALHDWDAYNTALARPREETVPYGRWIIEEEAGQRTTLREVEGADSVLLLRLTSSAVSALVGELQRANAEWVIIMPAEDELADEVPAALAQVLHETPGAQVVYADHDHRDPAGFRSDPVFKPAWSPETFAGHDYIGPSIWFRRRWLLEQLLARAGSAPPLSLDGLKSLGLDAACAETIVHLPMVLYHRRSGPVAPPEPALPVTSGADSPGSVSLLIPTRDGGDTLKRCVESIQATVGRHSCEIILVNNQSRDPGTCDFLAACAKGRAGSGPALVRVIDFDAPFNFSAINNQAAAVATGEVLGLLNDDIEVLDSHWLDRLVDAVRQPAIGCVGPRLCYPDGTIQHAGVTLGVGGVAAHPHRGYPCDAPGYAGWLQWPRNTSAVTGAALFIRRALYDHLGGMDESLAVAYNDVDLCLRALAGGWRNLYLPSPCLRHHESLSRGDDRSQAKAERLEKEAAILRTRWGDALLQDSYYNPNLSATREDFTLAAPLPPILPGQRPWGRVQRFPSGEWQ